jgi:hypothetical protein
MYSASQNFKRLSFKKLRENKPMKSRSVSGISLSNNRQCINLIVSGLDYDTVVDSLSNEKVPELLNGNHTLINMVAYSLYLWMDSHLVDYFLEPDTIQIADVDELNFFIKSYRKHLTKVYKKYGNDCVKHLLKHDSYLNQLEHDTSNEEFRRAKSMLYDSNMSVTEYRDAINEMYKDRLLSKLSKGADKSTFDQNMNTGKLPKSLMEIYMKFSFLNGDVTKTIRYFKDTEYKDIVQYHIDEIATRIQDLAMVTNRFPAFDGEQFTNIYQVDDREKTKVLNSLVLSGRNTDRVIQSLKQATEDNSGNVRYNPSKVLNYIKLKRGIDSITRETE